VTLATRSTHITQSLQGCVAIDNSNNGMVQYYELIRTNRMVGTINVYFVRRIWNTQEADGGGTLGLGLTVVDRTNYGVILADGANENDLAHELGHVLNLDYHAGGDIGHADDVSAGSNLRDTIWTRRRLMYAFRPTGFVGDGSPAYLTDVGYGAYVRGSLITVKNTTGDATDGETAEARRRARSLP
jgi:hypothetical protein